MWSETTTGTMLTFAPLAIVTQGCTKFVAYVCTVPLAHPLGPPLAVEVAPPAVVVPGRAQAATTRLPSARTPRSMPSSLSRLFIIPLFPLTATASVWSSSNYGWCSSAASPPQSNTEHQLLLIGSPTYVDLPLQQATAHLHEGSQDDLSRWDTLPERQQREARSLAWAPRCCT